MSCSDKEKGTNEESGTSSLVSANAETKKPPCPDCGRTDAEYFNKKYWCMCGTFYWIEKARGETI